ncbi:MAG: transporter substrate-binding domain-containing protein [Sulfurimonas sp.]|nr:transporter substrate-binding domain-containing protein [Sulfurimonas sp.]
MNIITKLLILLLSANIFASNIDLTKEEKEYLQSKPYLSVMNQDNFQPFSSVKDSKAIGYSVDIMNLIGKSINKDIKFVKNKTWKEQVEMLKNGSLDIFPYMIKNEKRQKFVQFSDKPFISFAIGFAVHKNADISNMKDLKNKRVAVVNDSFLHDHLKQHFSNIQLVLTDSIKESIKAITLNKADAALDNVTTLNHFIQDGWLNQIKITYVDDLGLPLINKLYMGIQKENQLLESILKKARASLDQEEIIRLRKKWFIEYDNLISLTGEEIRYLEKKPYITVMALENFQPFNFVKDEKALGYSVETMQLIAKQIGKEVRFINKPWGELLEMLKNGTLDVIPHIAVTDERKNFVDYTDFSHLTFLIGFAINKNNNIESMKDLKDKKIAVVNKYYIHDYLKKAFPHIELLVLKSTQEAVEAVAQNKAFAVIDNIPTLNYFMQEKWLSNLKIATVNDFGLPLETEMPMGVTKGNRVLKSILEKANSAIAQDQVIRLKQKWLNVLPTKTINNDLTAEELLYLKDKKTIKMCVLPNWLPFEQIDEKGEHKGIGADFMKIISTYIDAPVELVATKEWSQSLQNIKDRKCDILPVAMDIPSRRDSMNFTKPYVAEPFVIATKADELFIKDSRSISNKKVGVVKSYAFIEVLKQKNPSIDIVDVANTKEGLERVSNGELYGYIDTMPTIGYGIQKYSMLDLKIAGKLEFDMTLSIASRNDEPILNTIMQKALDSISEEERRTIIGKWIEIKVAQEFDYKLLWQISALFLIIVLAILYKNRAVTLVNQELVTATHKIEEQQSMVDKYVLMLTTDTKGTITDANEAFCKVTGYTEDDLVGNTHSIMQHPAMTQKYFDELWNIIETNKTWIGEIINYTKAKDTIYFNTYIEPIFNNNIKTGYRAIYEDITDKKRVEELSVTDKLTGLFNRLKLDEILLLEIEKYKRYKTKFSIIILDIDDFKSVNDIYGHDVGDHVLQKVSQVLRETIRITDVVGRWGGEEFVVICENTNLDNAYIAAEHIRESIQNTTHDKVGKKSVSIGVAEFKLDDTLSSIFKKADEALYEAKHSGKNRVVKYST